MKEEEITALARECANTNPKIAGLKTPYIREYEKAYADMLRFLLRRYALVEKKHVRAELTDARQGVTVASYCGVPNEAYTAKLALLHSLFPEIAKEVES